MKTLTRFAMVSSILVLATGVAAAADEPSPQQKKSAAMEMPKPPPEVAAAASTMAGTWRCTGTAMMQDGTEAKIQGTIKSRADLDKFWLRDSLDFKMVDKPKGAMGMEYRMESFATFDKTGQKWRRVTVDNMGGQMVGTADNAEGKVLEYTSTATGPMGEMKVRERFDSSNPQLVKASAQRSMDDGKTWQNEYEVTCKK